MPESNDMIRLHDAVHEEFFLLFLPIPYRLCVCRLRSSSTQLTRAILDFKGSSPVFAAQLVLRNAKRERNATGRKSWRRGRNTNTLVTLS